MKFLADTCTFVWFLMDHPALPGPVKAKICDPGNEIYLSVVSIWEIMLKRKMGQITFASAVSEYVEREKAKNSLRILFLNDTSIYHLNKLATIHKDPFDRMLICQSMEHGLTLLTPDPAIRRYPIKTLWD